MIDKSKNRIGSMLGKGRSPDPKKSLMRRDIPSGFRSLGDILMFKSPSHKLMKSCCTKHVTNWSPKLDILSRSRMQKTEKQGS